MNKGAVVILLLALSVVAGCGGSPTPTPGSCFITGINVFPPAATVNHTAAPPGNATGFAAFPITTLPGCGVQLGSLNDAVWTVSDTVNARIGNQVGVDYGNATCINAAASPITVTATAPSGNGSKVSATATLTCN
jgi:hypothetical protein